MKPLPVILAVPLLSASACAQPSAIATSPDSAATRSITVAVPDVPNLVQVVRVTPSAPAPGDTVIIGTVLRNLGDTPTADLEVSICGPSVRGTLRLEDPFVRCAGYSMITSLAPGDSTVDTRRMVVGSGPGTYQVEVNQLRRPETWASVLIEVRE